VPHSVGVSKHMVGSSQMLADEEKVVVTSTVMYSVYVVYEVVSYELSGLVVEMVGGPVKKVMLEFPVDVAVP
jgi:hypothetical protein